MLERGETKPETMEINKQEILMEIKSMLEEKLKERDKEMTEKGIKIGTLRIARKMRSLLFHRRNSKDNRLMHTGN
jgi:hypothetical protein